MNTNNSDINDVTLTSDLTSQKINDTIIRTMTGIRPGRCHILGKAWLATDFATKLQVEIAKTDCLKKLKKTYQGKMPNEVIYLAAFYAAINQVIKPAEINAQRPRQNATKTKNLAWYKGEIQELLDNDWSWRAAHRELRRKHTRAPIPTSVAHFIVACKAMGLVKPPEKK